MSNDNKLTIVLVVVVGLLALVAIIMSAVSITKSVPPTVTVNQPIASQGQGPPQSQGQGQGQAQKPPMPSYQGQSSPGAYSGGGPMQPFGASAANYNNRIYLIAVGHDYGSYSYFDDAGYLDGFNNGLVDMVCDAANVECRLVWDKWANCWLSRPGQHASGGVGLLGRWYDACAGWYTTVERIHVFSFSQPYLAVPTTNFFVIKGKNIELSSKDSIERLRIVFMLGWASDEKCLARETTAIMAVANIKYAATTDQAIDLLKNSGYDAIFTTERTLRAQVKDNTLDQVGKNYQCMVAGNALMARKDSDMPAVWDRGFNKLKESNRFQKYCITANKEHAAKGTVQCV